MFQLIAGAIVVKEWGLVAQTPESSLASDALRRVIHDPGALLVSVEYQLFAVSGKCSSRLFDAMRWLHSLFCGYGYQCCLRRSCIVGIVDVFEREVINFRGCLGIRLDKVVDTASSL